MNIPRDPFDPFAAEQEAGPFDTFAPRAVAAAPAPPPHTAAQAAMQSAVWLARFVGFDLRDRPLVAGIAGLPGHVVPARSAVQLGGVAADAQVVVVFEEGRLEQPIILAVLARQGMGTEPSAPAAPASGQGGEDRLELCAEREIVLRCGDASITLTRAGKVLIKGTYILSRSTGYNKIKGAAIDIN